jgi:hypothetical protein
MRWAIKQCRPNTAASGKRRTSWGERSSKSSRGIRCSETFSASTFCLYIGEGYKRSRNTVSIANSDPAVIKLANQWLRKFSKRPVGYCVQHHADQRFKDLAEFWGGQLRVPPNQISFQRKSNSSQLKHRTWRSKYGVLTVRTNDTAFRARLQGWIDCLKQAWLDSAHGA